MAVPSSRRNPLSLRKPLHSGALHRLIAGDRAAAMDDTAAEIDPVARSVSASLGKLRREPSSSGCHPRILQEGKGRDAETVRADS